MTTNYPQKVSIEFDRDELAKSFRRTLLVGVSSVLCIPLIILWLFLFTKGLDWVVYSSLPRGAGAAGVLVGATLATMVLWVVLSWLYLFIWGEKFCQERVRAFSAEVDGEFLRVVDGRADRKIHFRQIGDYEAFRSKKSNEIGSIRMRSNGLATAFLTLDGVKDLLATRDMLAQVDAERE